MARAVVAQREGTREAVQLGLGLVGDQRRPIGPGGQGVQDPLNRKSVVWGKRGDLGGRRII